MLPSRAVRSIIWILLFCVGLLGVITPLVYLHVSSGLPAIDTDYQIENLLRIVVEGERISVKLGQSDRTATQVPFARPDFAKLPKDLVALYLSQRGCPTYFQTPKEEGFAWGRRVFLDLFGIDRPGNGWCERLFAARIAQRLGITGSLTQAIAAHKIHSALTKDQLIAFDLESIWFDEGVVGVDAASRKLFQRPVAELQLAELAELQLALPPFGYYRQLRDCQNPTLIRQNRDVVLKGLAQDALVSETQAKEATSGPVFCAR